MRQLLLCLGLISAASPLAANDLIDRFLLRDDAPLVSFVAMRRLEARNDRFNKAGWLEARVTQDPDAGLQFTIISEGGSGYIRDKVLRKALEGERDLINSGAPAKAALSSVNYDMTPAGALPAIGEAAILLKPRRKDGLLVDGRAVVTDPEGDLLRVEGRLVKTPSFWTRSVHVVRRYSRIGGVRVPVEMESTAEVLIAGRSHFRMTSSFLNVNGIQTQPRNPELTPPSSTGNLPPLP